MAIDILIKGRKRHKVLFATLNKTLQTLNVPNYSSNKLQKTWLLENNTAKMFKILKAFCLKMNIKISENNEKLE